ncbi:O-antigen ligase family protein [Arthrobacter sp. OY3WO11]|uniref:O-antigen ligase family protein n=1 Tax=Arthrobacter sp. OY3WO11 TaxID=1835723 RepID=UPI0007D010BF|nr:O-antigen ligase family protein [Arthrobacter sp. OY3WO11]OAE02750.1 hypothetical protein A6A22_15925 [Arthrobacter sp. OY3WO11]
MKLNTHSAGTTKNGAAAGIALLATSIIAVAASFVDLRFGFAIFGVLAVIALIRMLDLGQFVPRTYIGWLYAAVIFLTCWAPSLGSTGTVARFSLAGLIVVALIHSSRSPSLPLQRTLRIGLALLLLSLLISAMGAASAGYGMARLLNWIMFVPLLFLALRRPDIKGAGFGIVATSAFQMIGVALQAAGLMGGMWGGLLTSGTTYNPETSSWLRRYTGFILNPNNLALVLALAVVVLAAVMLGKATRRARIGCLTLIAIFVVGIVVTGSRGGLVAVALGLFVLLAAAGRRGFALGVVAVGLAAAAYTMAGSRELDRVIESFAEIVSGTDASAAQRSGVWLTRFDSADGKWLLGSGFGGYAPHIFAQQQGLDINPKLAALATVDNAWLKIFLESGLMGVIGAALTMIFPALSALTKSAGRNRLWGITCGAVVMALIWRSISVDMLDQNPWNALVFLAVGLAAASTASSQPAFSKPVAAQRSAHSAAIKRAKRATRTRGAAC